MPFGLTPLRFGHVIRINPFKRWHAIRTIQFIFIFLTCNSDVPDLTINLVRRGTLSVNHYPMVTEFYKRKEILKGYLLKKEIVITFNFIILLRYSIIYGMC
jgi:hypothetical protein